MIQPRRCGIGNVKHVNEIAFFKERGEQLADMSFGIEC